MVFLWSFLIFLLLDIKALVFGCLCPAATILSQFPSELPPYVCCLNFSGSSFNHVSWSVFANETKILVLDLSNCNISSIDFIAKETSALQEVYLGRNRLTSLPEDFLSGLSGFTKVDLSENLLQELPSGFLQSSDNLQKLFLQGNQLRILPDSILMKPNLQRLELDGNPWACSCPLLEGLEAGGDANKTARLQYVVANLTCFSPQHLAGKSVWSVRLNDVCRPAGLTALFIILPLFILSALLLCWCCGRKKKKEVPKFSTVKKKTSHSNSNGQKHCSFTLPAEQSKTGDCVNQGILKGQLLFCPHATPLASTNHIDEEEEIKLGSVESLPRGSSCCSSFTEERRSSQEPDKISKSDLDTVSVTEVMKDSSDREKAYMTQSTEYYSLVPGIELDDSDPGEVENINLS
ncbi:leucine-rich repeat-containing protein 26 [Gouania willdenowi]|uniref:leucine-rich repeat-containing protein 26 n=1 Tax=Gouania willdenowi TaxID=441366 RepID=UPI001054FA35|nr:leucine-rich repeat-containing protein 26-like [Gouania willdenowi]XP_028329567.1 leucine-rich repeat-containing protein 26-like [Gouania willdenowi]XP_028329569.1 leucine-rich repeat-containing protein 26-like [Gouania willdenowi]XP_028329570.1 leucine-rich repeat-containing protein 26-like [Gouania willdenowi]XP_028329571.1 leucine-rich repeat-containing protein 26-like [Gouania willdenowi]XP_028329572.1 leucine-rich repeat-containing protein 26-like [Gouania willdenowi]